MPDITKIMDNEASRAYIEKHARTFKKWHISQIDGYLKMLWNSSKEQFQQYCEDLAETKFKINVYLHGETGVGKTKLAKEIAKAVRENGIKTLKSMEYGDLAARNSMDEYTDEEIIIIDDFRAILCSLMSYYLLWPLSQAHQHQS